MAGNPIALSYGAPTNMKYRTPLPALMMAVLFVPLTVIVLVTGDHVTGGLRLAVCFNTKSAAFVVQAMTTFGKLATICKLGEVMLAVRLLGWVRV